MTQARVRSFLATSIDGFIAGPGDDLSWLEGVTRPSEPAPGAVTFEGFMASVGAMLMGRRTFDVVRSLGVGWPYGDVPVFVATHWPLPDGAPASCRSVGGPIEDLVAEARRTAAGADVYLDGGDVFRQALDADLVDEVILTVIPVALGGGVRLVEALEQRRRFALADAGRYDDEKAQLRFVRSG